MSKTHFEQVKEFHNKFGLGRMAVPKLLSAEEQRFRLICLHEELGEYETAVFDRDAEEQLDALVDLQYFILGTAHRNGWNFDRAFDKVHTTNMAKEVNPDAQRRGFNLEVTKPAGWQAPSHADLVDPRTAPFLEPNQLHGLRGLIILDGPDATGKTTLGEHIAKVTGGEYIHLTWTPNIEEHMDMYRTSAIHYATILSYDKVVVLDRAWLSNKVYTKVYRPDDVGKHNYKHWRQMCEDVQACSIIALPSNLAKWFELYQHMVDTRDEHFALEEDVKMREVYSQFSLPFIVEEMNDSNPHLTPMRYDMFKDGKNPAAMDSYICNCIVPQLEIIPDEV